MRARPILSLAVALAALLAPNAGAAAKPQIEDPAGDQLASGDYDIVSVLFDTTKSGGKLHELVITFTFGDVPKLGGLTSYNLGGDAVGCGTFLLYSFTSAEDALSTRSVLTFNGCGSATDPVAGTPEQAVRPTVEVKDKTLVFRAKFADLPAEVTKATFDAMTAWTAPAEPAKGYTTADFVPETAFDSATSTSSFKVKS